MIYDWGVSIPLDAFPRPAPLARSGGAGVSTHYRPSRRPAGPPTLKGGPHDDTAIKVRACRLPHSSLGDVAWYKTVFGADVQYQDPAIAFLTYDEEHHRFAFVNMDLIDPDGAVPTTGVE